jgi:hypothetical protein
MPDRINRYNNQNNASHYDYGFLFHVRIPFDIVRKERAWQAKMVVLNRVYTLF